MTTSVQGKVSAMLICKHRPLKEGEKPKRRGDTTVFEATGGISPDFLDCLANFGKPHVSVKHDGASSMLMRNSEGQLRLYKRRDIRNNKSMPEDAMRPLIPESEEPEICWLDITNSVSPCSSQFLAGVTRDEQLNITGIWVVEPCKDCELVDRNDNCDKFVQRLIAEQDFQPTGTYELVGPKVSDHYEVAGEHEIMISKKNKEAKPTTMPIHVYVEHGAFEVGWSDDFLELDKLTDFIVDNNYEGLVFRFSNDKLFKVNRGHIGVEIRKEDKLRFI